MPYSTAVSPGTDVKVNLTVSIRFFRVNCKRAKGRHEQAGGATRHPVYGLFFLTDLTILKFQYIPFYRKKLKKESVKNHAVCIAFLGIICLPAALTLAKACHLTKRNFGGNLSGYFESHEKISFSCRSYADREYQKKFESFLSDTIAMRGYYIRIYNQIQYSLFRLSSRIIGHNGDIFEMPYIATECGLSPEYDFSIPEQRQQLEEYVDHLESIQRKLEKLGKHFIFYITPSKAAVNFTDIPAKYRLKKPEGFKAPYFTLKELLLQKNICFLDGRDFFSTDGTPDFYPTGIHWARPIEQRVSRALVEKMASLTGKNIPRIILKDLQLSDEPYRRDTDVFELMNILTKPHGSYYEYEAEIAAAADSSTPRFLLQGGSFSDGFFFFDYEGIAPDSLQFLYNTSYRTSDGSMFPLASWDDMDFAALIDAVDVVLIELNEAVIANFSNGFAAYLDNQLDSCTQRTIR